MDKPIPLLEKEQIYKGYTIHEYKVRGYVRDLGDRDIINFCDDGNFGGRVVRFPSGYLAHVYVYVD